MKIGALEVRVFTGAFTSLPTDFLVVNATSLLVVPQMVIDAAGKELKSYQSELIEANGHFGEGTGVVTPGFGLAARFLYHCVTPCCAISGSPTTDETSALCRALTGCLFAAQARACQTAGLPLFGSPLFGNNVFRFPTETYLRALIQACMTFSNTLDDRSLEQILSTVLIHTTDNQATETLARFTRS